MTISAKVIADSTSREGIRLTTLELRYPRFIHAEFMTHRDFSRNASSSRAIPVKRMIETLRHDPAMPEYWGSHKPGMQAGAELNEDDKSIARDIWLQTMDNTIKKVEMLLELGLHKQIANRMLEPWSHISVVCSSTRWANFFGLRDHPDAQPEIAALAQHMKEAMDNSTPDLLAPGEWHLPYIPRDEIYVAMQHGQVEVLKKLSAARCARVSYLNHDGKQTTVEEDIALYKRLAGSQPIHASPLEHQATPDTRILVESEEHLDDAGNTNHLGVVDAWRNKSCHGNFHGWIQHRKTLVGEYIG